MKTTFADPKKIGGVDPVRWAIDKLHFTEKKSAMGHLKVIAESKDPKMPFHDFAYSNCGNYIQAMTSIANAFADKYFQK